MSPLKSLSRNVEVCFYVLSPSKVEGACLPWGTGGDTFGNTDMHGSEATGNSPARVVDETSLTVLERRASVGHSSEVSTVARPGCGAALIAA